MDLILDRYRLAERVAAGGSAEVWRARDEHLGRDVAVKLLHPHLLPDERSRRRLVEEARAAAGLAHPGIVSVYDVDVSGEQPALVMELVEGESLSARLERDGRLGEADTARIVAEVAEALFHAHQRGVVHRDVKPGNILLSRDGRARLVDFGIAYSLAPSADRLTQTGNVMGTLRYMAPEQLAGGAIGPRTDLYGLGTVLHETLTGRPPFAAANPVALAEAQRGPLPGMEGIDPPLVSVTHACLAVEPTHRPLHAGAMAEALRAWLAGDPSPALALAAAAPTPASDSDAITQAQPRVATAAAVPEVTPAPAPPAPAPSRRRVTAGTVIGVLAVAAAGIALLLFTGALGGGLVPAPSATATPTPSPEPSPFSLQGLPRPVREIVQEYLDKCGESEPPVDVGGMNKREAEDYFSPLIEQCEEGGG